MVNPKIKILKNNPMLDGMARLVPDIVFSTASGVELKMQIIMPWREKTDDANFLRRPVIIFLQGSAWTFPDVNYQLPQLAEYARMGYVVATITHRSRNDGYSAPASLQDAKTAIRFLRKNANEYGIDPNRVCFWGTSSGGNTSLLIALTGDDTRYKTEEYSEFSDSVSLAVECFGPTDLISLFIGNVQDQEYIDFFNSFVGGSFFDHSDLLKRMSPLHILEKNKKYPPLLLIHGDADMEVPYEQSENMYKALIDNGNYVEMIHVEKAPHEDSFWSRELHAEILDFIKRNL
jgi:acetyl esterase/lipase